LELEGTTGQEVTVALVFNLRSREGVMFRYGK
jgi:hypothetical protein